MKNLIAAILLCSFSTINAQETSDYKYINVPEKFSSFDKDEYQLNNDIKSIFIPASFYHHKNLLILPYVAKELLNSGFSTFKFKFTIPENSVGWNTILDLSKKLNVDSHFYTLGHVDNTKIGFEYLNSDLILCTSLVESSTAVFPESFISKRPLAVSDRDFARKLCEDGVLYFDPLNPKDIAQTISGLISDVAFAAELVDKATAVLKKNYLSPAEKWQKQKELLISLGCKK